TGLSTKHALQPATAAAYELLRRSPRLRWVQIHAAGADRPIYVELRARGVSVSTASGVNADAVAQTALAGLLALARGFPQLLAAQRERRWAPLIQGAMPRELRGQTALLLGWGPIGRRLGGLLQALGLKLVVVRQSAMAAAPGVPTLSYADWRQALPTADWLLLTCPLSEQTRALVDADALALLPAGARVINVARGEIVVEADLIAALQSGRLGGAYLDVFEHEPLPAASPLWNLDNVIVTPHSAGHSDGNERQVAALFIDNLRRWCADPAFAERGN
ncbi:MAG: NAD(P)-dependent oxidoreductase, partial [Rubrivivax sp.]|nr:NAD(P)-dependent oxidoreductase [Rubrivivax sp.]